MGDVVRVGGPITDAFDIAHEINRRLTSREVRHEFGLCMIDQLPSVVCGDGFTVSIQASETHYCSPRVSRGPWWQVERGYPSAPMPSLSEWAEVWGDEVTAETMTSGVWGYVPIIEIAKVLASHGGLVATATGSAGE